MCSSSLSEKSVWLMLDNFSVGLMNTSFLFHCSFFIYIVLNHTYLLYTLTSIIWIMGILWSPVSLLIMNLSVYPNLCCSMIAFSVKFIRQSRDIYWVLCAKALSITYCQFGLNSLHFDCFSNFFFGYRIEPRT